MESEWEMKGKPHVPSLKWAQLSAGTPTQLKTLELGSQSFRPQVVGGQAARRQGLRAGEWAGRAAGDQAWGLGTVGTVAWKGLLGV